jgi:hypothetical protein
MRRTERKRKRGKDIHGAPTPPLHPRERQHELIGTQLQSAATIQCNIGFAELAVNLSDEHSANTIPVLIDILKDVPHIDFDSSLAWEGNCWVDTALFGRLRSQVSRVQIGHYPTNLSTPSSLPYSSSPTTTRGLASLSSTRSWNSQQPSSKRSNLSVVCRSCFPYPQLEDTDAICFVSSRRDFKPIRARVPWFLSSFDIYHLPMDTSTLGSTLEEPQPPVRPTLH